MGEPIFFAAPAEWRAWLEKHHATAAEISVGFWKRDTGKPSLTWPQSVDEALSFGWIDGVRHRIDDERYRIRFTPRKPRGNWSQVNIKRFAELKAEGRVMPTGQAAYDAGKDRTHIYSYEREISDLSPDELARLRENAAAWMRFSAFPPSYRKLAIYRVLAAKGAATRAKRLDILIDASARGLKLQSPTKVWDPKDGGDL